MDVEDMRVAMREADATEAARLRAMLNRGDPSDLPPPPPPIDPAP